MAYDPFAPGTLPVGVRTGELVDRQRGNRVLPFDVWYPADLRSEGQGRAPLVLFAHTSNGHRRQSTFLCTHLASHGYVVAAVDHTGNTANDAAARAATGKAFTPEERDAYVRQIIADRVPDLRLLLDQVLAGAAGDLALQVDAQRIGLIGWSFGGWAVLAVPEVDERPSAVVALAPGSNSKPLPGIIPATLTFAWQREVPTLLLVAEDDPFTPLLGQYELFARTPSSKRMFILRHAGHGHFGDLIDENEECSAEDAHTFTRGLALAHMDAVLKDNPAAQHFMAEDAAAALRDRGVDAVQYR